MITSVPREVRDQLASTIKGSDPEAVAEMARNSRHGNALVGRQWADHPAQQWDRVIHSALGDCINIAHYTSRVAGSTDGALVESAPLCTTRFTWYARAKYQFYTFARL